MKRASIAVALALAACGGSAPTAHTAENGSNSAPRTPAKAPPSAPLRALTFVDDDYDRALREARARHVPLFVDTWAAWCHSCMSMRSFVFSDPRITARANDFVWLAIDAEKKENAPFTVKFPIDVLPTLFVIEPDKEQAVVKWPGSLTAPELVELLDDAKAAPKSASAGDATSLLLRADRAVAAGHVDEAIALYRQALAAAPANWSRRGRLVDSLVSRLEDQKALGDCAKIAADEGAHLPPSTARADVAIAGATCAIDAEGHAEQRVTRPSIPALKAELVALTSNLSLPLLADDRSSAFEALVDLDKALGDKSGAKDAARGWASYLEEEAQRAPDARARAVFDPHRLLAYVEIGAPDRAIPMLEQSVRDFPDDYNPHARLARAYREMMRWDQAVAEVDRAIALAHGPRRLRIYLQKADIETARGDREAEKAVLREALDFASTIPLREGYVRLKREIEERLAR